MLELAATSALFGSCAWTSWMLAVRWLPSAQASVRLAAAAIAGYWSLVAAFLILASLSLFRIQAAVSAWLACAVAMHLWRGQGRHAIECLRQDWACAMAGWGEWRQQRYSVALTAAAGGLVLIRVVRSLLAPPLAWDALTYHLLKAGRWVQAGTFVTERAPDAWGYYEYFQPFGDYLWAWAMLPVGGDLLVGAVGLLVWATCGLGTFALARVLRAPALAALLATLFVAFNPAVFNYALSAHVENVVLAMFLLGAVFVVRACLAPDAANAPLACAALGVLAGVKFTGVPLAAAGVLALAVAAVMHRRSHRLWHAVTFAGCALAFAIALPPYARAWYETGSITYPVRIASGAVTLLQGNDELAWLMTRTTGGHAPLLEGLFVPDRWDLTIARLQFLNPGPAAILVVLGGAVGALLALRARVSRPAAVYLSLGALLAIASVATADVVALRTVWLPVLGRFLIVPLGVAAVFAALLPQRASVPLLLTATALNLPLVAPLGFGAPDVAALTDPRLLPVAIAILVAMAVIVSRRRLPAAAPGIALAIAVCVAWPAVRDVRDRHRHDYYRAAAIEGTYETHPLARAETAGYPFWQRFDAASGLNIAVSAGWNEYGHNWFRYPLLGSRLQNRVIYVPVTRDGSIVDYRDDERLRVAMDYQAWLRRLVEQQVDYVVLLHPEPPEGAWVRAHPEIFELDGEGTARMASAYRLNRAVALAASAPQVASR